MDEKEKKSLKDACNLIGTTLENSKIGFNIGLMALLECFINSVDGCPLLISTKKEIVDETMKILIDFKKSLKD